MVKKVRGSNSGDLTNARKLTIVRSVAIDRASTEQVPRKYRASYEHVRKLTSAVVNRGKLLAN